MPQAGVLPDADHVLDAGVDAVRGVDVGALAAPAPGRVTMRSSTRHARIPARVCGLVAAGDDGGHRATLFVARRRQGCGSASPSSVGPPGPVCDQHRDVSHHPGSNV
jgi:hypothetical protein